ncbi:MAG: bile acid:sodium symporter family protein [Sedimentisphaerales bacterium]|nr:bile acid:sodium symporter family protein [Sedimentisphaerales bacterium]
MFNKVLSFYTKYFAVWVLLFGAVAYGCPAPFVFLGGGMKWFFALTMFGIGVVLKPEDFRRIAEKPWIVLVGSLGQFTIMPLGALALTRLLHLPPPIAVGLVLTGSAPGAMASNVMSYIAKADAAYSVSLTTVSTLACPILTPGLTKLLAHTILPVSFWAMFFSILWTVVLPLLAGFALRLLLRGRIDTIVGVFPAVSVTFIVFICSVVIARNQGYLRQVTLLVLLAVVILNLYGMGMGYGLGRLFGMNQARRRTLGIEIGMQNAGLGTVLALEHIGEQAALPAALFVFICIITASILSELWRRNARKTGRSANGTV